MTDVFLTGATGLIGGELLRALISDGAAHVRTMVRARDPEAARARMIDRLARGRPGSERTDVSTWVSPRRGLDNVTAVAGDLLLPGLGLSQDERFELEAKTDLIIHCAAETSFIRARGCHQVNVEGMRRLIALARSCKRSPRIVYVSTACLCGRVAHRTITEEDVIDPAAGHHNEYTRSKARAECMLRASGLEFLIVRPSIVLSAGLPDRAFARAILWFVPLLAELDAVPIDSAARLDLTPVTFVVDSIVRLLRLPTRSYDCYSLSAGPDQAQRFGSLSEFLDRYYARAEPLRLVPPGEWEEHKRCGSAPTPMQRRTLSALRHYLPFLNMDVVFDQSRLRKDLGPDASCVAPPVTYLGDLLDLISTREAVLEASAP